MKRIISVFLAVILCVSVLPPVSASSASATQVVPVVGTLYDQTFKTAMDNYFRVAPGIGDLTSSFLWDMMDRVVGSVGYGGFSSYTDLSKACAAVNQYFRSAGSFWSGWKGAQARLIEMAIKGPFGGLYWEIQENSKYGYIIVEKRTGLVLCNSSGAFPYYKEVEVSGGESSDGSIDEPLGGKWVRVDKISKVYNLINEATMDDLTVALTRSGQKPNLVTHGKDYQVMQRANMMDSGMPLIYCDLQNRPYALRISDSSYVINQGNDYYTGSGSSGNSGDTTVYDQGKTENNNLIDVENNTIWFPDGTLNYINNLLYDESTKTYYVDAHQEYNIQNNTYVTNNYHYEYHINYTSITYIGASEEYNKTYELYYQLPDGRNSADLTAEELKALNVSVDVVPYIRSTDNTALRSLYHFDGNVKDSSYWNYATSFAWKKGASITYLESNAFNGCLYLDETEHEFEITAPSGIGSQDFTLQWRMYNSHTAAPVSDSWVSIGSSQLFTFSGSYITFNGTQYAVPVGNWYEVALIRQSGTLRLYLNGIQVASRTNSSILGKTILFHFGNQQQTYKQLDELRLLNYALVKNGAAYTPTAVPYDTNLALVLPDSTTPVADEYWSFNSKGNLLPYWNFSDVEFDSSFFNTSYTYPVHHENNILFKNELSSVVVLNSCSTFTNNSSTFKKSPNAFRNDVSVQSALNSYGTFFYQISKSTQTLSMYTGRTYTFSVLLADGTLYECLLLGTL